MTAEPREPDPGERPASVEQRLRAASFRRAPAEAKSRGLERILAEFQRLYGDGPPRGREEPGHSE